MTTRRLHTIEPDSRYPLPAYDRKNLVAGIAHIGFGAFHRAHQALYTHEVMQRVGGHWGIVEISLFSGVQLLDDLASQDHLYSVLAKSDDSKSVDIVGSVVSTVSKQRDGEQAVIAALADEQIKIISMTITEKGYCAKPGTRELDVDLPSIQADLSNPKMPQTAIGFLVESLNVRRLHNRPGVTLMSCDNLNKNGDLLKAVVLAFAQRKDVELAQWIATNVSFPNTMVDRIVPAVTEASLNEISEKLVAQDNCAVVCEEFRQWVIEDNFNRGRPDWSLVGAEFVEDVEPFEQAKLQLLNASHSFIAYVSQLKGIETVAEAMAWPSLESALRHFMLYEQRPSLTTPESMDVEAYIESLLKRFINKSLQHSTAQIAMDGSQKIPQRWLPALSFHAANNNEVSCLSFGIAAWLCFLEENGGDVKDPNAQQFQKRLSKMKGEAFANAMLADEAIFGSQMTGNTQVQASVLKHYQSIKQLEVDAALDALIQQFSD